MTSARDIVPQAGVPRGLFLATAADEKKRLAARTARPRF